MKASQVSNQLLGQLNNTNNGITIFTPTDDAFSILKSGTLNTLSDEKKVELVQFHIIQTYLSSSRFQTISNPSRTQAGNNGDDKFHSISPPSETPPIPPTPAPSKPKKKKEDVVDNSSDDSTSDKSEDVSFTVEKKVSCMKASKLGPDLEGELGFEEINLEKYRRRKLGVKQHQLGEDGKELGIEKRLGIEKLPEEIGAEVEMKGGSRGEEKRARVYLGKGCSWAPLDINPN
ncbi:Fasciclin-like arabinogalactan protein 11 [Hibiscus syriacus]|uniref:Fasciclin-like arabinogalactan protein 11 n=1 Tax=Hibiscus syriacus TaxID=106335 RepID=A0A6A3CJA3_HIBSY|nr:Fasciclin-like arabinogalactan protein 11 [Hibiscus syriacus]